MPTISPPAFKFTSAAIKEAIDQLPDQGEAILKDAVFSGLILRRRTTDWSFYLRKKIAGSVVSRHLADLSPGSSIPEIRKQAAEKVADVTSGRDEAEVVQKKITDSVDRLGDMGWDELLQKHGETAGVRESTLETMGYSLKAMRPFLPKKVGELTDTKAREVFKKVMESGIAESTAMGRMKHAQTLVETWRYLHPLERRPSYNAVTEAMRIGARKTLWKDAPVREGRLEGEAEISTFVRLCREMVAKRGLVHGVIAQALEVLLLSGCRVSEIFELQWADIDGLWINIPGERFKGGRDFRRPVTKRIGEIIEARREVATGNYIFESAKHPEKHIDDGRKTMGPISVAACGRKLTPHDLRRTFAASARLCGFDKDMIALMVGHASRDLTANYIGRLTGELPAMAQKVEDTMLKGVV